MRLLPLLRAAFLWLILLAPAAAVAQAPVLPGTAPAGAPAADPAAQRAELEALIQTLEDDQARAQLIERLRGLSTAQPEAAEPPVIAFWVERVERAIAERAEIVARGIADLVASVQAVPELIGWLGRQLTDEVSRVIWWSVLSQTGLAVALGVLASFGLRLLLRGWRRRRMDLPAMPGPHAKLRAAGVGLFVDVAGLLAFIGVTYAALQLLEVSNLARRVAFEVLAGVALARLVTAFSRAILAPRRPRARLVSLTDRQAGVTQRWLAFISGLAIYGYAGLTAALQLGLPWTVHGFLHHLLLLTVTILVLIAILRVRGHVAAMIRSLGERRDGWTGRLVPWQTLATAGPYVLVVWVVLQYLVWALRLPQGTVVLTRGALGTLLALVLLRIISISLDRFLLPPPRPAGEETGDEAEPAQVPATRTFAAAGLRIAGLVLALAVVLQAWGFSVAGWLGSATGRDVVGRVLGVITVSTVAGLLWLAVDKVAQRYITARDAEGNLVHNNRTRTLANIIRNLALTVALFVAIGHLLSALGVNTAALLAGAGVVGFAIGFGSQKLVQDLTTGLFILLGDTIRVGDVVQLGDRGGVVEAVSMRTVTLRDYNGIVHTIPYSSISIVANMTKDYAFAVFNVVVGYHEDVDRVMEALREIDSQMRREWPYRRIMLEPLDVAGVDEFTERGVTIMARSRTRAGEQWKVKREFNRRLKRRFEELGIAFPYPQRQVHVVDQPPEPERRSPFPRPEMVRAEVRRS